MDGLSEAQILRILQQAEGEWDKTHADGWNTAYLTLIPSLYHLQAKRIHEAMQEADHHG
jgi:hypothetical protein